MRVCLCVCVCVEGSKEEGAGKQEKAKQDNRCPVTQR